MILPRLNPATISALAAVATVSILPGCGTQADKLGREVAAVVNRVVTLPTRGQHRRGDVVENSYIVTFRAPKGASKLAFASFEEEYGHHHSYVANQVLADPRVTTLRYITTVDLANPRDASHKAEMAPPAALQLAWGADQLDEVPGNMMVVDFADDAAATSALRDWEQQGAIWYAEPNYVNRLMDNPYTTGLSASYKKANTWWHALIKLPAALDRLAASPLDNVVKPVVAVLDSGLDVNNQYIKNNVWTNPRPGASGCQNDTNGCDTTVAVKGVLGLGTVNPYTTTDYGQACPGDSAPPEDKNSHAEAGVCGHGTHVAGIIAAAVGDGAAGIGGVCPVCEIMPIKIIANIQGSGAASDAAILAGFKYLTLFKNTVSNQSIVRVANSSFGKYVRDRSVALLVAVLKKPPNEVLVVGAAGNEDSMLRSYPAALTDAVAVAAVGPDKSKAIYSNFGPWVSVSAPGGNALSNDDTNDQIQSTVPGVTGTGYKQGTSMACPVTAGVAGLVLSYDPGRAWQLLRDSIVKTSDVSLYDPSVNTGINYLFYYPKLTGESEHRPLLGSGIVDAEAALDGTGVTGYLGPQSKRVSASCGAVAGTAAAGQPAGGPRPWLWLLAAPAVALLAGARRRPT